MCDHIIEMRLAAAADRLNALRFGKGTVVIWLVVAVLAGVALGLIGHSVVMTVGLVTLGAVATVIWKVVCHVRGVDASSAAREVERQFPGLDAALYTAIEPSDATPGSSAFLRDEVTGAARRHSRLHDWRAVVSPGKRLAVAGANIVVGIIAFLALATLAIQLPQQAISAVVPPPPATTTEADAWYGLTVEPGDTEVERGTGLLVLGRFAGAVPPEATLLWTTEDGDTASQAMDRSLDDPVFGSRIDPVDQPLEYAIRYAGQESRRYRMSVFEFPRLEQADATLRFPEYTQLPEKQVQDVRRLTAIAGTQLELRCRLNKPVAEAVLVELPAEGGKTDSPRRIELTRGDVSQSDEAVAGPEELPVYVAATTLDRSGRYRLDLVDEAGRPNASPPRFEFRVLAGAAPAIKRVMPTKDVDVSAIEELDLEATVQDDFGVKRAGLTYNVAGRPPVEVTLVEDAKGRATHPMTHRIAMEELGVEPDELVSLFYWAEDIDPTGQPRRTEGDLFFASIRPFDRSFRQGDAPPNSPPSKQQISQLRDVMKLQKEIVQAAWNGLRAERLAEPSGQRTAGWKDTNETLAGSQEIVIGDLDRLIASMRDERSKRFAADALTAMREAARLFGEAVQSRAIDDLDGGFGQAQIAYQRLLKLRARQIDLIKAKSGQGGGEQKEKLDLELKDDENRYETQSQAQSPQEAAENKEDRQLLSRLRELAQRQNDLNSRIKELQTAIEQAETEKERREIERQLKRLSEEQQQIVRDAEELQQRMQKPENADRTAESQEQLANARENARKSSEALKDGQVSRAAAEGTRAGEAFDSLREEMQKRTSSAFADDLRKMRADAREAVEKQQELARALNGRQAGHGEPQPRRPSLAETPERDATRDDLLEDFETQRKRIENLTESMRTMVTEAEQSEPLLADKLYEAIRETRQREPVEALRRAEIASRMGRPADARELERIAADGLDRLAAGVDEAADSVLGDETEALRRAKRQIDDLKREVANELARGTGQPEQRSDATGESHPDAESQASSPSGGPASQDPRSNRQPGSGEQTGESPSGEQPSSGSPSDGQKPDGSGSESQGSQPSSKSPNQQQGEGSSSGQPASGHGQGRQGPARSFRSLADSAAQSRQQAPGDDDDQPNQSASSGGLNFGGGEPEGMWERSGRPAPLGGEDYLDWSDRLRDVEEILSDPKLRGDAAGIRDRAKAIRKQVRRHSAEPNWELVQTDVVEPLAELQRKVSDELLRRTSKELVPIDRVPVPPRYETRVQKYYERLGAGR